MTIEADIKQNKFKASGIEWMREIPTDWNVVRLSSVFCQKKEHSTNDEELLSVYRDYGVIPKSTRDDNFNRPSEDLSNYILVQPNDLVINKMKTWQGSIAISQYRGIVSPAYFTYKLIRKKGVFLPYVHHLLRSSAYIKTYQRISNGVRPQQWDLDPYQFKILPIPLPPEETQKRIADFIDEKTKIIDELIEKKEWLIELLREKRVVLITRAVTKGLNPNAKLKSSGIDWFGNIPAGWESKPLKFLFSYQAGGTWGDEERQDDHDIICIRVADFDFLRLITFSDEYTLRNLPQIKQHFLLDEKSIILEKSGGGDQTPVGRAVRYIGKEKATCSNFIQKLQVDDGFDPEFVVYLLSTLYFGGMTKKAIKQTTGIQNLDLGYFFRTPVYYPRIEEQKEIASHIREGLNNIFEVIKKIESQIEELKEYRSSLIYHAVTGKIKI